jgi:bifunctional aspartokinase / homoserine dehydrogenase 1
MSTENVPANPTNANLPDQATLVMKFGGTSVGSIKAMTLATQIVRDACQDWPRLVVVASAMSGVTNQLLDQAGRALRGDVTTSFQAAENIRKLHFEVIDALVSSPSKKEQVRQEINALLTTFINLCQAIAVLGEATPRALDAVGGLGERMSVRLLAAILESAGVRADFVEATQLIVTDDNFQSAHPDFQATALQTRHVLGPLLEKGIVPVVTGFIAATSSGVTTTLGRGGSDYSASILAAALPANEVWIWTDVDGVMTADPRLVPDARTISEISYREVSELAYFGAKVLHPLTIRPVIEAGIGLRVCNTFNPSHPGTRLVSRSNGNAEGAIKAVTAIRGLSLVTVEGRGMLGVPGMAARTFGAVAATGTSVPLISQASSEQSICFAVPIESAAKVVNALEEAFAGEIARRDIDRIWASGEVVIISVVGDKMRSTPGVSGRVFTALGAQNVNVIAIAQGSSEVSISLIVDAEDTARAVRSLHELIH